MVPAIFQRLAIMTSQMGAGGEGAREFEGHPDDDEVDNNYNFATIGTGDGV